MSHRSSRTLLIAPLLAALAACAASTPKDPGVARAAIYQADIQVLVEEMALAIKSHYTNIAVKPDARVVKTAWHALRIDEQRNTGESPVWGAQTVGKDDSAAYREFRRGSTSEPTRYFVRFDAKLAPVGPPGSNQWKVVVVGQASVFDPRGIPTELKGAERPYWLDTRIASLEVSIYDRLQARLAAR